MRTVTVFRVFGPDGKGPYRGCYYSSGNYDELAAAFYASGAGEYFDDARRFPPPSRDCPALQDMVYCTPREELERWLFGFESEEQLYRWFDWPAWRREMNARGFYIRTATLSAEPGRPSPVVRGTRQIMFDKRRVVAWSANMPLWEGDGLSLPLAA